MIEIQKLIGLYETSPTLQPAGPVARMSIQAGAVVLENMTATVSPTVEAASGILNERIRLTRDGSNADLSSSLTWDLSTGRIRAVRFAMRNYTANMDVTAGHRFFIALRDSGDTAGPNILEFEGNNSAVRYDGGPSTDYETLGDDTRWLNLEPNRPQTWEFWLLPWEVWSDGKVGVLVGCVDGSCVLLAPNNGNAINTITDLTPYLRVPSSAAAGSYVEFEELTIQGYQAG